MFFYFLTITLYPHLVTTFILFLEKWIQDNKQTYKDGNDEYDHFQKIKYLLDELRENTDIYHFISIFEKYIEPLNCFNFIGIYILCSLKHNPSRFSIGNAFDIYHFLVLLKPVLNEEHKDTIHSLELVFKFNLLHKTSVYSSF